MLKVLIFFSISIGGSHTFDKEAYSFVFSTNYTYQINDLWSMTTCYINDIEKDFGGEKEEINYTGSVSFGFSRKLYENSKSEIYLGLTNDVVENQNMVLGDTFLIWDTHFS